jgi:hypothetical protein
MRRHLTLLLVVGLLSATVASVHAAEGGGTVGIRLLEGPADRMDDPRAYSYIVDHLAPGATILRQIEVSNTTAEPQPVQLYAAGADVTDQGWSVLDGRQGNELSGMVTVEPGQVVVPPGGTRTARVLLEVPADTTEGERYGVVWAELAPSGGEVKVVNRVGIRMYVSIGAGGEPASDFSVETLTAVRGDGGVPELHAAVANTGGRAVDVAGEVELLDGPAGITAGPFPTTGAVTLAVGRSGVMIVRLPVDLPVGPWRARLVARSGTVERSAEATITFPEDAGATAGPVAAVPIHQDRAAIVPIAAGLVGIASAAVLSVWFTVGRRPQGLGR